MLLNLIKIFTILPIITAYELATPSPLPPPHTKPCPFNLFRNSNIEIVSQPKLNRTISSVEYCLEKQIGRPTQIYEATCDQLMCAYNCMSEAQNVVCFLIILYFYETYNFANSKPKNLIFQYTSCGRFIKQGFSDFNIDFIVIDDLKEASDAIIPTCLAHSRKFGYENADAKIGYTCKTDPLYYGNCFFDYLKEIYENYVAISLKENVEVNINSYSNVIQNVTIN